MRQGPKGWSEELAEKVDKKRNELETGCLLLCKEGIFSMREHELREVFHQWLCLNMQAVQHLNAAPAANQLDYVPANSGTEEHHGTCGTEGTSEDVLGFKYQV